MRRPDARRRGGTTVTTIGFLGVGVSSAVLLAAGARLLGPDSFSGLAVVWTVASVFGFGVAIPVEQLMTRRLNVGAPHAIRRPLASLAAAAVVVATVGWVLGSRAPAAAGYPQLVPAMVVSVLGWTAVVAVRGRLAGSGDLVAYGGVLGTESVVRVALVAAAVADRGNSAVLLGAAVGGPLLVAAAAGLLVRPVASAGPPDPDLVVVRAEPFGFVAVSASFQVCLNAPPLLLEWKTGATSGGVVGAFVVANSYFRVPTVLMGGVSTHALVALSHAWGRRDLTQFRSVLGRALRTMALLATGATGIAVLAAPWLLPLYNGGPTDLPVALLASMALSTVVAVLAGVAVQPLLASGHGRWAGGVWLAAAFVTCGFLAVATGTGLLVALGLLAGPLVALAGAALALRRLGLARPA